MELVHIHRILKFDQSPWLKGYIDLNMMLRNLATNKAHKDLFKLFVDSIFGKTMENEENRIAVKLFSHIESIGKRAGAERYI